MTKAAKIFQDTYTECRIHIKAWGIEFNPNGKAVGFTGVITDQPICTRTLNEIQRLLDAESRQIDIAEKYGAGDPDYRVIKRDALKMVQSTIDNSRASLKKFDDMLKA